MVWSSESFDVIGDDLFRAIANRHHTEDACDPDENAEDGECCTMFIFLEMPETCGNCIAEFHNLADEF